MAISLAYSSGEEGGLFTCSYDFYLPSQAQRKGEGVGTVWEEGVDTLWEEGGNLIVQMISIPAVTGLRGRGEGGRHLVDTTLPALALLFPSFFSKIKLEFKIRSPKTETLVFSSKGT